MARFKNYIGFLILLSIGLNFNVNAQEHLVPPNGAEGVPGPYYNSFVIKWASVERAVAYEYILSDNPLCFAGCPGDTRQAIVTDTTSIEFNLQEDKWYYWITRVIYPEKDTTGWSDITSFLAITQEGEGNLAKIYPNPSINGKINVYVDWAINPQAKQIEINVINHSGIKITHQTLIKNHSFRYQDFEIDVKAMTPGLVICIIQVDDNPNNQNNRIIEKIILNQ